MVSSRPRQTPSCKQIILGIYTIYRFSLSRRHVILKYKSRPVKVPVVHLFTTMPNCLTKFYHTDCEKCTRFKVQFYCFRLFTLNKMVTRKRTRKGVLFRMFRGENRHANLGQEQCLLWYSQKLALAVSLILQHSL